MSDKEITLNVVDDSGSSVLKRASSDQVSVKVGSIPYSTLTDERSPAIWEWGKGGRMTEPGRELDKLVAEAMGQTDFNHPAVFEIDCSNKYGATDEFKECPSCGRIEDDLCCKPYSTDIAAAWQAWEWLHQNRPDGWKWVALGYGNYTDLAAVLVLDINHLVRYVAREIEGETYPHAICLAVLEAVKEKTNEP